MKRLNLIVMDASKETGVNDSRAVYIPPCVVRMKDLKQGAGQCAATGSGDMDGCFRNGNSASGGQGTGCYGEGNSPIDE